MSDSVGNDITFHFNYCAFLFSSRNITFRMQKEYSGCRGFKEWYVNVQEEMKASELLRKVIEKRNECAHQGNRISAANYFLQQMCDNFQNDELFSYDLSTFLSFVKNISDDNKEISVVEIDFARRARNYDSKQKSITHGATRNLAFGASIILVGCNQTIIEDSNGPETTQQPNGGTVKKTVARWLYDVKKYLKKSEDFERADIISLCKSIMKTIDETLSPEIISSAEDIENNPRETNLKLNNIINECTNQLEVYEKYVNECKDKYSQETLLAESC
jgi:hypothetical protein